MKTLAEVEKRKQCELNFLSIHSLEAQIPDDPRDMEDIIMESVDREYYPLCLLAQRIDSKYE